MCVCHSITTWLGKTKQQHLITGLGFFGVSENGNLKMLRLNLCGGIGIVGREVRGPVYI